MAELNPELQQVESQGSVGGVSPNVEAMSAGGRGLEAAGQSISEGGNYLYKKSTEEANANTYADIAQARENYTENLNNALQTGNLDTEQFAQQMKDDTDKIGENLSTPESRNFFVRQQARLTGAMMLKASHVAGQIAFNNTVDDLTTASNSLANTARKDPGQLPDLIDQSEEMLNQSVQSGQLPAGRAEEYRKKFHGQIAYGAGLGLSEMDPGKAQDGTPNENYLSATLKKLDPSDTSDPSNINKYLSPQQIEELQNHGKQMDSARALHEQQVDANAEKLLRAKSDVWINQNYSAIRSGQTHPQDIINNPNLDWRAKDTALNLLKEGISGKATSDTAYVNQVQDDMINGKVTSLEQLRDRYNQGKTPDGTRKMSGDDYDRLATKFNLTPDGRIIQQNQKMIFQEADKDLKFKGSTLDYDFRNELSAAADQYVKDGKGTERDFYSNGNPKDADSWRNVLNKYRAIATPIYRAQVGAGLAMGQLPQNVQYSTAPTKDIQPSATPPSAVPTDPGNKQAGESISQWKSRPSSNFNKKGGQPSAPTPQPSAAAPPGAAPQVELTVAQLQDQRAAKEDEAQRIEDEANRKKDAELDAKIKAGKEKGKMKGASTEYDF